MTRRLIAIGFGLALLGCDRQAPADYFPLKEGQQRAMKVFTRMITGTDTTDTTEVKVVEVVRGLKDLPGMGKVWVVESPRDSGRSSFSFFRKLDDCVIQLLPARDTTKPPAEMLYLALPLVKGLKWYDTKAQHEVMEVTAQETVQVQAGTYPDCYVVAVKSTRADWSMTQWLAPNVGAGKWENRAVWTDKDGTKREMLKRAELVGIRVPPDRGR
jgi:hypothetical protein